MARGTGVFMPRSYEDVSHAKTVSATAAAAAEQGMPQSATELAGRELPAVLETPFRCSYSRSGSPEVTSPQVPADVAQSPSPANTRAGITLRRVPWGSSQASNCSNTSSSTKWRPQASTASSFAVGSCPDAGGMYLRQPPPPPPPTAGVNAASPHKRFSSTGSSTAGTALHSSAVGPGLGRSRSMSSTGLGYGPAAAAAAMRVPTLRVPNSSWDDRGASPSAAAGGGDVDVDMWLASAGGRLSSTGSTSGRLSIAPTPDRSAAQVGGVQQFMLQGSVEYSGGSASQLPGVCGTIMGPSAAAAAAGAALGGVRGTPAGPWQSAHGLDSANSCPLLPLLTSHGGPAPPAAAAAAAGDSPHGFSSSCLLAAVGSWTGNGLPGGPFCDDEQSTLQDTLLFSGLHTDNYSEHMVAASSLPSNGFMAHLHLQAAATQQQQQQQQFELADMSPVASVSVTALGQQLAALRASAAAPAATIPVQHARSGPLPSTTTTSCMAVGSLDSSLAAGLLSGYTQANTAGMSLEQQLQLANTALGFEGSSGTSVPISIPTAALNQQDLPAPAAAAGHAYAAAGSYGGDDSSSNSAVAVMVAQLKLQQLMAVEQIQQQLQDEVMRLLPLI